MLHTSGPAWVNGAHVPRPASAIFSGDLVQTRSDSLANITQSGSSITVLADSLVQFQGSSIDIEHGGVTVATSKQTAATAGVVKVSPASSAWTEFNVTDTDGTVRIAARKGDLTVTDGNETFTLAQGQETSRDEGAQTTDETTGKKKKKNGSGVPVGATGGILNAPLAVGIGGAAVIGVTTWVLTRDSAPASPATP